MKLEKCFSSILSRWRLSGSAEGSSDDVRHCQVLFRDGERGGGEGEVDLAQIDAPNDEAHGIYY